ncbi:MAG: hypothetical protein IKV94_03705 [Clostridia bacterium]|nr:hypothetical protein [Clostridia bacterium]
MRIKVIVFVTLLLILIIVRFVTNINNEQESLGEFRIVRECLDERFCKCEEDVIIIGNNEKQIQNGFYDVKIAIKNQSLTVNLNKLWYKKFNENLYEIEYVDWLISYIEKSTNFKFSKEEKENLSQKIISKYTSVKDFDFNIQENINIGQLLVTFDYSGCELILIIERRTNEKKSILLFNKLNCINIE